ncbi:MAG: peptidylprolyl isomerase [Pseudomonadota bacterium]
MRAATLIALSLSLACLPVSAQELPEPLAGFPQVLVTTSHGEFVIELEGRRAPVTAARFAERVREGYYDGTIFHRVIKDFVIQGGGHKTDYSPTPDVPLMINESGNGLSNEFGTVAMARDEPPHTATTQFYVNLKDNTALDPRSDRWGYTVFGRVTSGMETVEKIGNIPTGPGGPFAKEVPAVPAIVRSMRILTDEEVAERVQAELDAAREALEGTTD